MFKKILMKSLSFFVRRIVDGGIYFRHAWLYNIVYYRQRIAVVVWRSRFALCFIENVREIKNAFKFGTGGF